MLLLFKKLITFNRKLLQKKLQENQLLYWNSVSIFLLIVFITAILSHIIFSSSLCYDGSYILLRMALDSSFYFNEKGRLFFHALYQLPIWLFINFFPSNSLSLLTKVFSFSLIWIHIFSLIGCWLILPKNKKNYIFFPLFAFLVGPLTALDYSLSVSLSVFSYVWFTAFVTCYSDLSSTKHKIILFLTPLPLFFSHELMSYASPLLILLCFLKTNYKKTNVNNTIIAGLILCFLITFFIAVYFIIFPAWSKNRDSFLQHLLKLSFLYKAEKNHILLHIYMISALVLVIIPFISNLYQFCLKLSNNQSVSKNFSIKMKNSDKINIYSFLKIIPLIFISSISIIINILLLFPHLDFFHEFFAYSIRPNDTNRIYIFFILPFTLFLWFLFEKKIIQFRNQNIFLTMCLISSISLVKWRVEMDYKFYNTQNFFSKHFQSYKGIHEEKTLHEFSFYSQYLLSCPYMISPSSLVFPRTNRIKAIILNPPNPQCLTACQNKKKWKPYYTFDHSFHSQKEQNLYCKKKMYTL